MVSICLGTNVLSDGDGKKDREPFDPDKFTSTYIDFVKKLFEKYPNTKLALLTSPMISGEKGTILLECLQKVKAQFEKNHIISIFEFDPMCPSGCATHPDLKDHKILARELLPFYDALLKK